MKAEELITRLIEARDLSVKSVVAQISAKYSPSSIKTDSVATYLHYDNYRNARLAFDFASKLLDRWDATQQIMTSIKVDTYKNPDGIGVLQISKD